MELAAMKTARGQVLVNGDYRNVEFGIEGYG
jgi:hypothetical protein